MESLHKMTVIIKWQMQSRQFNGARAVKKEMTAAK